MIVVAKKYICVATVMTTSVSANCKLPSHHRIFSINYLHVLMDNYIAFFLWNFMSYRYNIQNTDKRYLFS